MSGKLLDTNIVIALLKKEPGIGEYFKESASIFVPSIVIGELRFGARKSNKIDSNLTVIRDFVERNVVLSIDSETTDYYGKLKFELERKGKPIPDNDIWIAAVAFQFDLELISKDKHFAQIDNLRLKIVPTP
jgi:tRNA(fMet)-specific endonuclease VapC